MTPLEAYELSLRGHEICTDIQDLFTEFRYESDRYDEAISELEVVLKILIDERYYSYHSNLIERAGDLLNPNEYNNKKPNINLPDLVRHLDLFSLPPYVASNYLYGEEFNDLAVKAALRRGIFENAASPYWGEMLKKLANQKDVINWMKLSESLFHISTNSTQRISAILSLGFFDADIIEQHKAYFKDHIDSLLKKNVTAIEIEIGGMSRFDQLGLAGEDAYRSLKNVGHLSLVHEFLNVEISTGDSEDAYCLQRLVEDYAWEPSERAIKNLCRTRPAFSGNKALGIGVYLLQLPALPAEATMPAWDFDNLSKLLVLDGTEYPFGKIVFNKRLAGEMISNSARLERVKNPYEHLRSLGVADDLLMASSVLREDRMGSDLGL